MVDVHDKKQCFPAQSIGDSALQVNGKGFPMIHYGLKSRNTEYYRKVMGCEPFHSTGLGPNDEL